MALFSALAEVVGLARKDDIGYLTSFHSLSKQLHASKCVLSAWLVGWLVGFKKESFFFFKKVNIISSAAFLRGCCSGMFAVIHKCGDNHDS